MFLGPRGVRILFLHLRRELGLFMKSAKNRKGTPLYDDRLLGLCSMLLKKAK